LPRAFELREAHRAARARAEVADLIARVYDAVADVHGRDDPQAHTTTADLVTRAQHAVAELPRGRRAAVLLFYLSGLSYAETAALLGIDVGAVRTRLHTARGALRTHLWAVGKSEENMVLEGEHTKNDTITELDAWLAIDPTGAVTLFTGKVELGMGAVTGLVQIVAEELDVPLERITAVTGDTARTPDHGPTWGRQTIAAAEPTLRQVAAHARYALLERAAHLGVPQSALTVQDGVVRVKGNGATSVSYADAAMAGTAPILWPPMPPSCPGSPADRCACSGCAGMSMAGIRKVPRPSTTSSAASVPRGASWPGTMRRGYHRGSQLP
jgi:hypothetical protein